MNTEQGIKSELAKRGLDCRVIFDAYENRFCIGRKDGLTCVLKSNNEFTDSEMAVAAAVVFKSSPPNPCKK